MAGPFRRLSAELAKLHPGLKSEGAEVWGASREGSRASIRRSLADQLSSPHLGEYASALDLQQPPQLARWSVSVAHTRDFGGWMALPRPKQIGWDVELEARIRPAVIERVCTPEEIAEAPRAAFLWCAKEAFFKALEDFQPLTIPQLSVTAWRRNGEFWLWDGFGPQNGRGLLLDEDGLIFAACIVPD